MHVIQVGGQDSESMNEPQLNEAAGSRGVRLSADGSTWEVTFSTRGELAGYIKRTGGRTKIDANLTTTVTPQSGIMAETK